MFKLETWLTKMRLEAAYKSSSPSVASSVKSFGCAMNSGHEQVLINKACRFSCCTPGACPDLGRTPLAFANPLMAFYVHRVRQGVAFCRTAMVGRKLPPPDLDLTALGLFARIWSLR